VFICGCISFFLYCDSFLVSIVHGGVETCERYLLDQIGSIDSGHRLADRDFNCQIDRKAVYATADGWKCKCPKAMLCRDIET
jgi:hypothetical protein